VIIPRESSKFGPLEACNWGRARRGLCRKSPLLCVVRSLCEIWSLWFKVHGHRRGQTFGSTGATPYWDVGVADP